MFAAHHPVELDEGHQRLLDHAPVLEDGGLRSIKIRLVAGSFGPAVTSVVLWQITHYVEENQLPWTPSLRAWWLGYQRPGGYYVPVIGLRREKPVEFSVKLQDDPHVLGLENPYPHLQSSWNASSRK